MAAAQEVMCCLNVVAQGGVQTTCLEAIMAGIRDGKGGMTHKSSRGGAKKGGGG